MAAATMAKKTNKSKGKEAPSSKKGATTTTSNNNNKRKSLAHNTSNACKSDGSGKKRKKRALPKPTQKESAEEKPKVAESPNVSGAQTPAPALKQDTEQEPPQQQQKSMPSQKAQAQEQQASSSTNSNKSNSKKKSKSGHGLYDSILAESQDLLGAAAEAQALGRLKLAHSYLILLHARLLALGKRFDRHLLLRRKLAHQQQQQQQLQQQQQHGGASMTVQDSQDTSNASDTTLKSPEKLPPKDHANDMSVKEGHPQSLSATSAAAAAASNPHDQSTTTQSFSNATLVASSSSTKGGNSTANNTTSTTRPPNHADTNPIIPDPRMESWKNLLKLLPSDLLLDHTMMDHIVKSAVELHHSRQHPPPAPPPSCSTTNHDDATSSSIAKPASSTAAAAASGGGGVAVAWSKEEHVRCLHAAHAYGQDYTKEIARVVGTRTEAEVRVHLSNKSVREEAERRVDLELEDAA